jgi:hypothetical protein
MSYTCYKKYNKKYKTNPLNRGFKENTILNDINLYLKTVYNIDIIHNKKIEGGSSQYRPDALIKLPTHNIIIEIDERQHCTLGYNNIKEKKRIDDIFHDLNNMPLILIRFNPDKYIDFNKNKKKSLFIKDRITKIYKIGYINQYNLRLNKLKEIINNNIFNIPNQLFTEYKLFFDYYNL